jgi:hypothetical protein
MDTVMREMNLVGKSGGRPLAPDWLDKASVGRWYRISGDKPDLGLRATAEGTRYLRDCDPAIDRRLNPPRNLSDRPRRLARRRAVAPWSGRCGFSSITEAWNGAVFADHFGPSGSMIVFGGGHTDYFGSDVHAFDLCTRKRISDGYVSGASEAYGQDAVYPHAEYPDGSPLPPHTYEYVQYDRAGNDLLLVKGQLELGPNVTPAPIPHMFNLDRLSWRRGPRHSSAGLNSGGWTTWDAARRILWANSGNDGNTFIGFCPDGSNVDGTFGYWSERFSGKLPGDSDHNAMMLDPVRDIIVVSVHSLNALYAIDPSDPGKAAVQLVSSGAKPAVSPYAAIEFATNLDAFVYYSARGGPTVCAVQAPAGSTWAGLTSRNWSWRNVLATENSLDPVADAASMSRHEVNLHHTFGRFRVATYGSTDLAVLVRHIDSPVYVMKLS